MLELIDISVRYGEKTVLSDCSLVACRGSRAHQVRLVLAAVHSLRLASRQGGAKTENIDRLTANQLDKLFRGLDLEGCERLDMLCVRCDNNVA